MSKKNRPEVAQVCFHCGRNVLFVGGLAFAVEGERCPDLTLPPEMKEGLSNTWRVKSMEWAARRLNAELTWRS